MTTPGARPDSLLPRGLPFGWRGVGVVLAAVLGASLLLQPGHLSDGPVVCAFRRVTGRPCPGCGLTRSFVAMGDGDLVGAFLHHPFGPLLFVGSVLALAAIVWRLISGQWPLARKRVGWVKPFMAGLVAVWILWAAGRTLGLFA